jgi:Zn-finger nucleic acid-binding protein
VPIDHCQAHGMWFDKSELDEVLLRSRGDDWRDAPPPSPADSLNMLVKAVRVWRTK